MKTFLILCVVLGKAGNGFTFILGYNNIIIGYNYNFENEIKL